MEHIASHLGADPVNVREVNFLKAYPFNSPQPLPNGARPSAAAGLPASKAGVLARNCTCPLGLILFFVELPCNVNVFTHTSA